VPVGSIAPVEPDAARDGPVPARVAPSRALPLATIVADAIAVLVGFGYSCFGLSVVPSAWRGMDGLLFVGTPVLGLPVLAGAIVLAIALDRDSARALRIGYLLSTCGAAAVGAVTWSTLGMSIVREVASSSAPLNLEGFCFFGPTLVLPPMIVWLGLVGLLRPGRPTGQ